MRPFGKGPSGRPAGFTLIEILVAMAVVATAFVSFYRLFSQSITADNEARFYTVAPLLAQQKMAEVTGGWSDAGYQGAGDFSQYPEYRWQVQSLDVVSETLGEAVADMKQVDVTIFLADDEARRFSLRTYAFLDQQKKR